MDDGKMKFDIHYGFETESEAAEEINFSFECRQIGDEKGILFDVHSLRMSFVPFNFSFSYFLSFYV